MSDPFSLLKVSETADDQAIRKAYLKQVKQFPPEQEPEKFQQIRAAYDRIKNERSRLAFRLFQTPSISFEQWLDKAFALPEVRQFTATDICESLECIIDDDIFRLPEKPE